MNKTRRMAGLEFCYVIWYNIYQEFLERRLE